MKDISYAESVEIENQLFESRKRDYDFSSRLVAFIITLMALSMIGAFMLLVGMSVR